jgi:hypothetical protein
MEIFSFPPISEPSAEVLILGTMPGERALSLGQYYGHRGNQFPCHSKIRLIAFNGKNATAFLILMSARPSPFIGRVDSVYVGYI